MKKIQSTKLRILSIKKFDGKKIEKKLKKRSQHKKCGICKK
jgi:hypothetical protein